VTSDENQVSLAEISQGQELHGRVKKLLLSGAIIDFGGPFDGLLHISDLGKPGITRISDLMSEGQEVTVWVKRVDASAGRISVTMAAPPKHSWKDLQPGLKTTGKVVRLESFGAFVDIGAETDGLVHISEMSTERVRRSTDVVSEGDVIDVWVKDVDRKSRRVSLTMLEPPDVDIRSLRQDQVLTGKVVRLESFGAFVDIGAGRDGMIHISEMGRGYVGRPAEILSVGDEVQVRVVEVDPRRGRISLSMKDLPTEEFSFEDEADDIPTSMELALRRAMEKDAISAEAQRNQDRDQKRYKQRRSEEQDDIIARTLSSHQA
jgi:small subunit ribosomal protein S1